MLIVVLVEDHEYFISALLYIIAVIGLAIVGTTNAFYLILLRHKLMYQRNRPASNQAVNYFNLCQ